MLFCGTSLAARIEQAECRLLTDAAAACARRRPGTGVLALSLGGGVATHCGPGSPMNKVAGLGFAPAPGKGELERVERAFAERGTPVQVELSCLAEPGLAAALTRRGYRLQGFENVLGRPLPIEPPATVPGVSVTPSPDAELAQWLDTVVSGFEHPDAQGVVSHESFPREALEAAMADLARADGFVRYVARRDGALAGGASLRVWGGVAQLCGAATRPEHRRRGVQAALLVARLVAASQAGCDVAVVTTQPGSKSQENVQRQGFSLLYTRAVLVRASDAAS